jgi:hypothetical protein
MTDSVKMTREVAVKLLKAGVKCCAQPSVRKLRQKGKRAGTEL